MDAFINVIRKCSKVEIKINDMLERYKRVIFHLSIKNRIRLFDLECCS